MKGKVKHIVGIVLTAITLPASSYLFFFFYLLFAVAFDLNGGLKGEGIGTALALTIVFALLMIVSLVFLIVCSVSLAKINKKEKALKLAQSTAMPVEGAEEAPIEEKAE